ncbi:hypothetical protein KC362_g7 [Hortaea werneckii]|nr:hypothetical protein KC362_g7 [Hortaea werneckii]
MQSGDARTSLGMKKSQNKELVYFTTKNLSCYRQLLLNIRIESATRQGQKTALLHGRKIYDGAASYLGKVGFVRSCINGKWEALHASSWCRSLLHSARTYTDIYCCQLGPFLDSE